MNMQKYYTVSPELKRWSNSALFCFKRGCVCEGCPIGAILTSECLMKITVIKLIKKHGMPKGFKQPTIRED